MKKKTVEEIRQILSEKIPKGIVTSEHTADSHFYRHNPSGNLYSSVTARCGILEAPHLKKWAAKLAVEFIIEKVGSGTVDKARLEELKKPAIFAHQDAFESAGDVGTRGHAVIEDYLNEWMITGTRPSDIRKFIKDTDKQDYRVFAIARSAEQFCIEYGAIPIASEMKIASVKHGYAGTLDSLMMISKVTKVGNGSCRGRKDMFGIPCGCDYWRESNTDWTKLMCQQCGQKAEYVFSIVDWKTSNSIDKVEYAMQTAAYWEALKEMTGLRAKEIYVVRIDKDKAKYEVMRLADRSSAFKAFKHLSWVHGWLENGKDKMLDDRPKENIRIGGVQLTKI